MRLRALLWVVAVGVSASFAGALEAVAEENYPVEIVPQLGHFSSVDSVVISPDGKTVLSAGSDPILWDLASGREIRKFVGHSGGVNSVAISPDGKTALSGGNDHTLILWDLATGHVLKKLIGHSEGVRIVAISPDGTTALSGSEDKTFRLWDLVSGREIKKLEGHTEWVTTVAFAPDGKTALSAGLDNTLRLWDLTSGREIRKLADHFRINAVAIAPDGLTALSANENKTLTLWDLASGREIKKLEGHKNWVTTVAFAPDGKTALSGSGNVGFQELIVWDLASGHQIKEIGRGYSGGVHSLAIAPDGKTAVSGGYKMLWLWDLSSGRAIKTLVGHASPIYTVAFAPDGKTALSGGYDKTLRLWDLTSGRAIQTFVGHSDWVNAVAFAPDGKTAVSGDQNNTLILWDLASGREIKKLTDVEDSQGKVTSVAFAPDGKRVLSGHGDYEMKLWDLTSGRKITAFKGSQWGWVRSVAFAADGKTALSGGDDYSLILWNLSSGRVVKKFVGNQWTVDSVAFAPDRKTALSGGGDETLRLWDLSSGREIRKFVGHSGDVNSVAFAPNGKAVLSGGDDRTVRLWNLASGREIKRFVGYSGGVSAVAFAPDGKTALSGSNDGMIGVLDIQRGETLAFLTVSREGTQLAMTPKGFFTASQRDTDMLAVARGLEVTGIGQVYQSLYNPDLVREALAGDPNHEVEEAAKAINLEKVLDAGPPPAVVIASPVPGVRSDKDLVNVTARITDRGRGVGRIEWRINGVTAGVMSAPAGPGPDHEVSQQLALDHGENRIEVIAYEGHNLLASLPAQTTVVYDGTADTTKPKLYMLAIGIDKYVDKGWNGQSFPPLTGSVPDASAFGAEVEKAAAGQYEEVRVTLALDTDATSAKLDEIINKIASEISPRDTFVLYAATHGYSHDGNYYMIPQDYQGGPNPEALKTRAIGQDRIQDWIANRIKAKKAIILLDTCESGALIGGYAKSRADGPVSDAAVGRLHEATGRPVLTAASAGQPAYENYKGHGVFTYALMEALHKGDVNNDGKIEVTELAAYVEGRVPELFAELKQSGWAVKGLAAAPIGRGEAGAQEKTQTAHFGSTGEDFELAARLP